MPKTGFRSPTVGDTPEYIEKYIKYKVDKINALHDQMKKLYVHIERAEKVLSIMQLGG